MSGQFTSGVLTDRFAALCPDRLLVRRYVWRAAAFWLASHAFLLIGSGGTVVSLGGVAAVGLVAVAGWLGMFDANKRHELQFLRNLGAPLWSVAAIWCVVAALLEIVLAAVWAH